jgi:uncharacterized protein (UPF0548 family)
MVGLPPGRPSAGPSTDESSRDTGAVPFTVLTPTRRAELEAAAYTYDDVGATRGSGAAPDGFRAFTRTAVIGHGQGHFERAAADLFAWEVQLRSGARVAASSAIIPGAVADIRIGLGPVAFHALCRVVFVIDEPQRKGFAYGTLAGHPESGEELFTVELLADETVRFGIRAFSRPATALARLAGPVGRVAQVAMTRRYLRALR